jgi:competence protein ComEC
MYFGGSTVEVLYLLLDLSSDAPSDNNHSVVVRIVYGNRAFLLTGDIESDAENALINGGGILKADLIKVPHHGSRTSSTPEFISAVQPEYAVISVGRHSRFGHPHKEVVERWLAAGSTVMTTGERGMITVSTDGKDLSIKSFK